MADAKPWIRNKPEARLSIALDRFLRRALVRPFYATAINDQDGETLDVQKIVRRTNRGVKKGQLDWDVAQPGIWRKVELKRGKNTTSDAQDQTITDLTACGFPPIVAWELREAYEKMAAAGFVFAPNVATVLQHCEEQLAGWDREADLIKSGEVVKKRAAPRKAQPRYLWKVSA